MASDEHGPGPAHDLVGASEDLAEHLHRQLFRERGDREGEEWSAAHRENVVERVRGRDRSVVAGVVDDGREEVEREDDRALVVEAVDGGVVRSSETDQQVLGFDRNEALEQLLEAGGRILRSAAPAGGEIGQLDVGCVEIHS